MVTVRCFLVTAGEDISLERLRAIPQVLDVHPMGEIAAGPETGSPGDRLNRQRQIIHARRGDLKRFLSQRRLRSIPGGNGHVGRVDAVQVPARPRFRRLPTLN